MFQFQSTGVVEEGIQDTRWLCLPWHDMKRRYVFKATWVSLVGLSCVDSTPSFVLQKSQSLGFHRMLHSHLGDLQKEGFFFRLKHTTGFQEALIFFRTTWSDEWILKIVCKGWMVLDQLWIFTCIWDEISRHVSLFAKHCLLDICGNQCRVRHSPSTFREVQQHFERVDQLHSIINTCINSSNKHSYMYRVLSGSSHLVSG